MVIMLTYRCSLDCDHCLLYATGPEGVHMSPEVLEAAMKVFRKTGSNQLGLAGGEPLEYPHFWDVLAELRRESIRGGFSIKVATSGEPFDKDPSLIERAKQMAPVKFQITRTHPFYKGLSTLAQFIGVPNVYQIEMGRFYESRKAKERGFRRPTGYGYSLKTLPFCSTAWPLKATISNSHNFGAFVRQWEGYSDLCTIHAHPDGSIRLGPIDCCQVVGNVVEMAQDFRLEGRRAMTAMGKPCRRCGLKGDVNV